jgi:hypothetical protein
MAEVSKLPSAQQAKRQALIDQQSETPPQEVAVEVPPVDTAPAQVPAQAPAQAPAQVSGITPEELEDLRRRAAQADILRMERDEAQAALTRPPEPSKAGDSGVSAPASGGDTVVSTARLEIDAGDTTLDDEQQNDFGDAVPAMEKVSRAQIKKLVDPQLDAIVRRLAALETGVATATETSTRVQAQTFVDRVKAKVKNFDAVVTNPKWNPWLQNRVPGTTFKYADALGDAHAKSDLGAIEEIFNAFEAANPTAVATDTSAFASVDTANAGSTRAPTAGTEKPTLKMSDRRKLSEDILKGRISREDGEKKKAEFTLADKEGRLDYNS